MSAASELRDPFECEVRELLDFLDAGRIPHRILHSPSEDLAAWGWIRGHFPVQRFFGHILWDYVPGSVTRDLNDYSEVPATLNSLCDDLGLGNPMVFVTWNLGRVPVLELRLEDVRRHVGRMFRADWDTDTFVYDPHTGWCVEIYHLLKISFGWARKDN